MFLCDIGNTSYHFLSPSKNYKESVSAFDPQTIEEKVYFICVNAEINKKLSTLNNWIDLSKFVEMHRYYKSMGVDRIFAVEAVENALIVDAGSAITVDVVKEGDFLGGFIYPGVNAMQKSYENISSALAYDFNFDLELQKLPKDSQNAISYGYLKLLYNEVISHNLPIILTGGDALKLKKLFNHASVNETLIFEGMKKVINQNSLV